MYSNTSLNTWEYFARAFGISEASLQTCIRRWWALTWYASSCCAVKMVCLFPISAHKHPGPGPSCSAVWAAWICQIWNTRTKASQSQGRDQVSVGHGAFGSHYKGAISSFSPLWMAAPRTMGRGSRPASCQVLSTPFSATLIWPTPRPALKLHSVEAAFCPQRIEFWQETTFVLGGSCCWGYS